MALEGVDASIPLQAGRNLPQYGPDYNAIAQMQRTAMAMQQQKQVMDAQNVLKGLYSNPQNFDPNTLQPTPEAFATLARLSPPAAMDLRNNLVTMQEKQARTAFTQGEIAKEYRDQAKDLAARSISAYDEALKTMPWQAAIQKVQQEIYSPGIAEMKRWMPPQVADQLSPTFDPMRARITVATAKSVEDRAKDDERRSKDFKVQTDYGRSPPVQYKMFDNGKTTTLQGSPYTPTGVAETKGAEATLYVGKTTDGKDITIRQGPTGGWVNEQNEPVQVAPGSIHKIGTKAEADESAIGQPTHPEAPGGQDYLKSLDTTRADQIKGYAEGRLSLPGSFSLKSPFWLKMLADIQKYDPSFEQGDFARRQAVRKSFTTGKEAGNVTSFNTALGHFGNLSRSAEELIASEVLPGFKPANWIEQTARGFIGADAKQKKFATDAQALAEELERAFRGTGGNVTSIMEWKKNLNSIDTPETMRAVIREAADLLGSRIYSLQDQYRRGMGPAAQIGDLFTPKAREIYNAIERGDTAPKASPAPSADQPAAPAASAPIPPRQPGAAQGDTIEPPPRGVSPPTQQAGGAPEVTEQQYNALPPGEPYRVPGNPRVMFKPY